MIRCDLAQILILLVNISFILTNDILPPKENVDVTHYLIQLQLNTLRQELYN